MGKSPAVILLSFIFTGLCFVLLYQIWVMRQQLVIRDVSAPIISLVQSPELETWLTYEGRGYTFRYPPEAILNLAQENTTRVHFIGNTQRESGRTQTEIFDGYIVAVEDLQSHFATIQDAYEQRRESFANICDPKDMSDAIQVRVDQKPALTYTTSCNGNYTTFLIQYEDRVISIVQMVAGEPEDEAKYQKIVDQIRLTFHGI